VVRREAEQLVRIEELGNTHEGGGEASSPMSDRWTDWASSVSRKSVFGSSRGSDSEPSKVEGRIRRARETSSPLAAAVSRQLRRTSTDVGDGRNMSKSLKIYESP
jgi:hypothetical protein